MKIEGPGQSKGISKTDKKAGSASAGGASFSSMISRGPSQAASSGNMQSIAQIDALLALQGAEDPTARKSKNALKLRANTILDMLDGVRLKMLGGQLTVGDMIDIADVVASHREKISDPVLTDIMDEIDLRAQVEIAKMRVGLEKQQGRATASL